MARQRKAKPITAQKTTQETPVEKPVDEKHEPAYEAETPIEVMDETQDETTQDETTADKPADITAKQIRTMTVIQLRAFIESQNNPDLDNLMDVYKRDQLQKKLIEKMGL
jgi:hypothetical protein